MARITVKHRYGDAFDIHIRGSKLVSDEPVAVGGEDEGPTPTELMVAGLAACAAEEAVKYLSQAGLAFQDFEVEADFAWDPAIERVASVTLRVTMPHGLTASQAHAAEVAMLACPARKMLTDPPALHYDFRQVAHTAL